MSTYKIVLFDLDGTLSDPKVGITKSVQYALNKLGINEPNLNRLDCFIGPPLQETFSSKYGFNEHQTKLAIEFYRERFKEKGMYENTLYPQIPSLLSELKNNGVILVVATSKPTVFSNQILDYFTIRDYFKLVVGSNLDGTRSAKTEIIEYIVQQLNVSSYSDVVMIGDRMHDIIGAKNVGVDSIGVTYGYGSEDELKKCTPTYIVHHVEELRKLLVSGVMVSNEKQ
ncbi:HAD family hydrolase [Bacillus salitolerans]|uniref:HAD family hydrolase n=1 Tax=Bacillus salitolerans TaxID=1437434 RepID=A0ABW4LNG5_9BACI